MKLTDFDTIIFDLDYTIWNGSEDNFWAKKLTPPLLLKDDKIYDDLGKYIQLQPNIKNILNLLHSYGKNIGFITLGGLLDVDYDLQPAIICLQLFDVYKYFNFIKIVQYKTKNKADYFIKKGHTIFIDDDERNLVNIASRFPSVKTINRKTDFHDWNELI